MDELGSYAYVVVQFYTWFNFDFPLFDIHYHINSCISIKKNNGKSKLNQEQN